MNKKEAQQAALEDAKKNFREWAIIYSYIGNAWGYGSHPEVRYLESYFDYPIIWIASRYDDEPEWSCYKAADKPVDYVAETGATGEYADLLRRAMSLFDNLPDEDN